MRHNAVFLRRKSVKSAAARSVLKLLRHPRTTQPQHHTAAKGVLSRVAPGLVLVSALLGSGSAQAGPPANVNNGQTDLTLGATYSTNTVPTPANDVVFTNQTYSPSSFMLNSNLTFGSLNDLSSTALTISNTGGTASTLTLNGSANSTAGASATDLLFVASGGTLNIQNGASALNLALGAVGNLDIVGTANIASAISGTSGLTKTGAGTLTLSGTNTYTGATTISGGTLSLTGSLASSSSLAFGSGGTFSYAPASAGTQTFVSTAFNGGNATLNVSAGSTLALGTYTRSTGATMQAGSTGTITTTTSTLSNGIIGPWATIGTGASTRYATLSSGTLSSFTGTTQTWTNLTSATTNYEVSDNAATTFGGSTRTANTVRYAGTGVTITLGNSANGAGLISNGILNVGTGTLLFNTTGSGTAGFVIGSTNELVLNAANAAISVTAPIHNTGTAAGTFGATASAVTVTGANTVTFGGANTFTGNLNVNGLLNAGLALGDPGAATSQGSALGNIGTAVARNINVNAGGTLSLTAGNTLGTGSSTNTLSAVTLNVNPGGVFQTGLNGSGSGWWNKIGAVNLNGGTIHVGSGANTTNFQGLALIGTVTAAGSTASTIDNFAAANSASDGIHLGQNATAGQSITFNVGDVTGNANVDLTVAPALLNTSSTLTASGLTKTGAGTMLLSGANAYTGPTTVNAGILQAGVAQSGTAGAFGNNSAVTLANTAGAILDLNNFNETIGSLNGGGTTGGNVTLGSGTLTTGGLNTTATYGGFISGTGGLTKTGTNTLTLTGANNYTGATNINGGALTLGTGGSLGNTAVTVAAGGTLGAIGATNTIGGNVVSAGTVSLAGGGINTFTLGGPLTTNAGAFTFDLGGTGAAGSGTADQLNITGAASGTGTNTINLALLPSQTLTNGTYTLITAASGLDGITFGLGAKPSGFNSFTLNNSATAETVTITANAASVTEYWTGLASQNNGDTSPYKWGFGSNLPTPASNWSTNQAGTTDALQVPGAITDTYFTATNAAPNSGNSLLTQLDGAYNIKGLYFDTSSSTNGITAVGIDTNTNSLTIGADGLTVLAADTSSATISNSGTGGGVVLNGSQNWANNNNTRGLTVSTGITGFSGATTLTLNGTGVGGVTLGGNIGNGTATKWSCVVTS